MDRSPAAPEEQAPLPKPAPRRGLEVALALLPAFLVLAWSAGFVWYAATIPVEAADSATPTDAIVVLTGGQDRIASGVALLGKGLGHKLFVSGVTPGVDVAELLHVSERSAQALECCVILGHHANSTRTNARETASWMAAQNYRSLRLVTANYHMRRALLEFRHAMPDIAMLPQPVFPPAMRRADWWLSPSTLELVSSEYDKYLVEVTLFSLENLK